MFVELCICLCGLAVFFFKQKTAYEVRISDWSSDVCSSDLHATDTAGQTGESKAIRAILPERIFNHPVARAVVAERKRLVADPEQNTYEVIERLGVIAWHQDLYDNDFVVFLRSEEHTSELQSLMRISYAVFCLKKKKT